MITLSEVLQLYKASDVDAFLKRHNKYDLNEKTLFEKDICENWKFLGGSSSNGSNVSLLQYGEKGVVERITNAVDAVIEKQKNVLNIKKPSKSRDVISKAFPKFYNNEQLSRNGFNGKNKSLDADKQVMLYVNDGSKSNKPTFDIIDKGDGINGKDFDSTILSINKGNKLRSEKSYLIGAFGQGGSTSLPFTYSQIIVSKNDDKYFFTIIKEVILRDFKNRCYVYYVENDEIVELYNDYNGENISQYLVDNFINNDSGTIVRMIETEISRQYRTNDMARPGMLGDYINTELFDVGLPVNIFDNRAEYRTLSSSQERYIYGSMSKLYTTSYLQRNYSGEITIEHNNQPYKINYYVLLPTDEEKWAIDSECKEVYQQFNVYNNPIIYTVNGQTITTERYLKIGNAGLNFLKYRLLVVVNLDDLGNEKYHFFTSDRAKLVNSDLTNGFLDEIIKNLVNQPTLIEINNIIANKSVNSNVDSELLDDIKKEVKRDYNKFLKSGIEVSGNKRPNYKPKPEEIFADKIEELVFPDTYRTFYKDQNVNLIVTTKAQKHINENEIERIYLYVDDKQYYDWTPTCMNGRIMITIDSGKLNPGTHNLYVFYSKNMLEDMTSNIVKFDVLDQVSPEKKAKSETKDLDLDIQVVDGKDDIATVNFDLENKKITILLCLDCEIIKNEVYGKTSSVDEVKQLQQKLIKPLAYFLLFYGKKFNEIEKLDDRNNMLLSLIKSFTICNQIKQD